MSMVSLLVLRPQYSCCLGANRSIVTNLWSLSNVHPALHDRASFTDVIYLCDTLSSLSLTPMRSTPLLSPVPVPRYLRLSSRIQGMQGVTHYFNYWLYSYSDIWAFLVLLAFKIRRDCTLLYSIAGFPSLPYHTEQPILRTPLLSPVAVPRCLRLSSRIHMVI